MNFIKNNGEYFDFISKINFRCMNLKLLWYILKRNNTNKKEMTFKNFNIAC